MTGDMALTLSPSPIAAPRSENDLVVAVRAGDDRAFSELYSRYQDRIRAFIQAKVHDHGRAEDIAQEVFISALRRLRASEQTIAFKPWIYEIAKNACIDEFRRTRRTREVSLDADSELASGRQGLLSIAPTPPAAVESKLTLSDLQGAFGGLSQNHHQLLVMREFEGRSYSEIAERTGMSIQMVESSLFRARRKLSEEYDELASGRRCEQVQSAIETGRIRSLASVGIRERRQLMRHLAHCQPCRRTARLAGVDETLIKPRSIAARIAALLPFPLWRWPWRGGGAGKGVSLHAAATAAAPAGSSVALGPAAAAVAALAIAGAGGSVVGGVWTSQPTVGPTASIRPAAHTAAAASHSGLLGLPPALHAPANRASGGVSHRNGVRLAHTVTRLGDSSSHPPRTASAARPSSGQTNSPPTKQRAPGSPVAKSTRPVAGAPPARVPTPAGVKHAAPGGTQGATHTGSRVTHTVSGVTHTVSGVTRGLTHTVSGLTHTVSRVTRGLTHTVSGVTHTVSSLTHGTVSSVAPTVAGVTHGTVSTVGTVVGGTVKSVLPPSSSTTPTSGSPAPAPPTVAGTVTTTTHKVVGSVTKTLSGLLGG